MPLEKRVTRRSGCREARHIRGALIVSVAGGEPPGPFFLIECFQVGRIDTESDCLMILSGTRADEDVVRWWLNNSKPRAKKCECVGRYAGLEVFSLVLSFYTRPVLRE